MEEKTLAIIGGGRWACVTLKVLSTMCVPYNRIVIVSKNNALIVQELIDELQPHCDIPLTLVPDPENLLSNYKVHAAMVINGATEHYSTALTFIENGIHTFVENPLTLSVDNTRTLIKAASLNNVCLLSGLNYRFCEYLKNFAIEIARQPKKPLAIFLDWADSLSDVRYFNKVTYVDTRTDIAQHLMAHVWAIFSTIFNTHQMQVNDCKVKNKNYIQFFMEINSIKAEVSIEQDTDRRRKLTVCYDDGNELSLDFTNEPGIMRVGTTEFSADPTWDTQPRPLNRQYNYFFEGCRVGGLLDREIQACLESSSVICKASELLQQRSKQLFANPIM